MLIFWNNVLLFLNDNMDEQHLSNIRSATHENVKQHWGWVEKKRCLPRDEGSCEFMDDSPSWQFTTLPSLMTKGMVIVEI